jgi:RND family efflux transporter MFP subunit
MKKITTLLIIASILLISCGEAELSLEAKKTELKNLKSQVSDLQGRIKIIEKEVKNTDLNIEDKKIPVRIETLKTDVFHHYIEQPGKIKSKENVLVSAEMGGLIIQINATEGEWVEKGSSIIDLDSDIMKSNIAELNSAVELAKTTFERQEVLWNQQIGSELQYLQIKNQFETLQKKLEAAETQLSKLSISAPISGVIEDLFLNIGELAAPGRPAFRIVNTKKVYVEADVAERYANILKKNTPVKINFRALGISKEAPLSFVGQVINPENSTFKVQIELNNSNGFLKPNGIASLEIQDYMNEKALIVPSQIVKKDMRGDYLFLNKKGHAEKTYVEVGLSQSDRSVITKGLKAGDQIITEGYSEVIGGSKLDIKR